jgi:hypothetical protein
MHNYPEKNITENIILVFFDFLPYIISNKDNKNLMGGVLCFQCMTFFCLLLCYALKFLLQLRMVNTYQSDCIHW